MVGRVVKRAVSSNGLDKRSIGRLDRGLSDLVVLKVVHKVFVVSVFLFF